MKRVHAGVLVLATALFLTGCDDRSSTGEVTEPWSDPSAFQSEQPTLAGESMPAADPGPPVFWGAEPSHAGPSDPKIAGELTVWIKKYFDKYPDDSDRYFYLYFCPSDEATPTSWTMARPGAIVLKSTSGEDLRIVALSQVDGSVPAMVDEVAEGGEPVPTTGCLNPQGWGVFFSDSENSSDPALSAVVLTADSGASVTFTAEEIPAFNQ